MNAPFDPHKSLDRLESLRDEVELKLHLAGMELRDEWSKLEPEVRQAAHLMKDASDASLVRLRDVLHRVEEFVERLA